jgi:putative membrane protein
MMAGELKHTFDKVTDAIGGTAGKMSASATTSADGFVESAAIGNLYELEAARLAMQRSGSEPIRVFAGKMLLDHTTAMHQMSAALEMNETSGVAPPPTALDTRRETMLKHLVDSPVDDFDATYVDQQVLAHEETVSLMRSYADGGDNAQLRSVALGALPVVERHLHHAKMMKQQQSAT